MQTTRLHAVAGAGLMLVVGCGGTTPPTAPPPPPPPPQHPQLLDFELVPLADGHVNPQAGDINSSGHVVGYAGRGQEEQPYIWGLDGSETALGYLEFPPTEAFWISDRGAVAGFGAVRLSSGLTGLHPFLWTPEEGMRDLFPGDITGGRPWALNNQDDVVGDIGLLQASEQAFLWTVTEGLMTLGSFGGGISSARDINDRRTIIGRALDADSVWRPFVWTPQRGLFEPEGLPQSSELISINDSDDVLGATTRPDGGDELFVWNLQDGTVRFLRLIRDRALGREINNLGWVLGRQNDASGSWVNTIWPGDGRVVLLPEESGWQGLQAFGLSDAGHVVGMGQNPSGGWQPVVWVYDPER